MSNKKDDQDCCKPLSDGMSPSFFKALCDPNRITLLSWLCACRKATSVKELAQCCTVDLSVVSRHLSLLKNAKILSAEKKGKEVYYSVNGVSLVKTLRDMADAIERTCQPKTKGRPKAFLKKEQKNEKQKRQKKQKR